MITSAVLDSPLDTAAARAAVADDRHGAVVTFEGVVRDHDRGREVSGLSYSAHPDATRIISEIVAEIETEFGVRAIACHRIGDLAVGDVALVAVCASAHRSAAFAACPALVDRIKERLPIWKKQGFGDGSAEWVGLDEGH